MNTSQNKGIEMIHRIDFQSGKQFLQVLKNALCYVSTMPYDDRLMYISFTLQREQGIVQVVSCDTMGYYESRLPIISDEEHEPSLPGENQCIFIHHLEAKRLVKVLPRVSKISLEIDDKEYLTENRCRYSVIQTDTSEILYTGFIIGTVTPCDFSNLFERIEEGKKNSCGITNMKISPDEIKKLAKVLPKSGTVNISCIKEKWNGIIEVTYSLTDDGQLDSRVIFTSKI